MILGPVIKSVTPLPYNLELAIQMILGPVIKSVTPLPYNLDSPYR